MIVLDNLSESGVMRRAISLIFIFFGISLFIKTLFFPVNVSVAGSEAYKQGAQVANYTIYITAIIIFLFGIKMLRKSFNEENTEAKDIDKKKFVSWKNKIRLSIVIIILLVFSYRSFRSNHINKQSVKVIEFTDMTLVVEGNHGEVLNDSEWIKTLAYYFRSTQLWNDLQNLGDKLILSFHATAPIWYDNIGEAGETYSVTNMDLILKVSCKGDVFFVKEYKVPYPKKVGGFFHNLHSKIIHECFRRFSILNKDSLTDVIHEYNVFKGKVKVADNKELKRSIELANTSVVEKIEDSQKKEVLPYVIKLYFDNNHNRYKENRYETIMTECIKRFHDDMHFISLLKEEMRYKPTKMKIFKILMDMPNNFQIFFKILWDRWDGIHFYESLKKNNIEWNDQALFELLEISKDKKEIARIIFELTQRDVKIKDEIKQEIDVFLNSYTEYNSEKIKNELIFDYTANLTLGGKEYKAIAIHDQYGALLVNAVAEPKSKASVELRVRKDYSSDGSKETLTTWKVLHANKELGFSIIRFLLNKKTHNKFISINTRRASHDIPLFYGWSLTGGEITIFPIRTSDTKAVNKVEQVANYKLPDFYYISTNNTLLGIGKKEKFYPFHHYFKK